RTPPPPHGCPKSSCCVLCVPPEPPQHTHSTEYDIIHTHTHTLTHKIQHETTHTRHSSVTPLRGRRGVEREGGRERERGDSKSLRCLPGFLLSLRSRYIIWTPLLGCHW